MRNALIAIGVFFSTLAGLGAWFSRPGPKAPPRAEPGTRLHLNRKTLKQVDLHKVHEKLIPEWSVAQGGMRDLKLKAVQREVAADVSLTAIVDEFRRWQKRGLLNGPEEVLGLVSTWNALMSAAEEPFRLQGEIATVNDTSVLYLRSYEVLHVEAVVISSEHFELQLHRRIDGTNLLEPGLGHTTKDHSVAILQLDPLTRLALDIWATLSTSNTTQTKLPQSMLRSLRDHVEANLPKEAFQTLKTTSHLRSELVATRRSIHQRRGCGAGLQISKLPYNGLSEAVVQQMEQRAKAPSPKDCIPLLPHELSILKNNSETLRTTENLQPALERLVGLTYRAVAAHELQHLIDKKHGLPACTACEGLDERQRFEASAYLASFANSTAGPINIYQACSLPQSTTKNTALSRILRDIGDCKEVWPVHKLKAVDTRWFGERQVIAVHELPAGVPVSASFEEH